MVVVDLEVEHDPVDPEAIDVWVRGHVGDEPCRFRLDTGAGTCRLPTNDATRTLPSSGTSTGVGASGLGLHEDEIRLPSLRLGELTITDVDATRMAPDSDAVPLLGMSALIRHRNHFRFTQGQLALDDSSSSGTDLWSPLTMHAAGQPTMSVRLGDIVVDGVWDTGAGVTAVDAAFADLHPELFEPIRAAIGIDSSGVEISSELSMMDACTIGGIAFPPSACALVDLSALNDHLRSRSIEEGREHRPMSFIIGMPLIHLADWSFDFPAGRWTVQRPVSG